MTMDFYYGILDQEIITTAMQEYKRQMLAQGNAPRAAVVQQICERLYRQFAAQND